MKKLLKFWKKFWNKVTSPVPAKYRKIGIGLKGAVLPLLGMAEFNIFPRIMMTMAVIAIVGSILSCLPSEPDK